MRADSGRVVLAFAVLVSAIALSGCGNFADREDMPSDPDPYDGVFITDDVIKKMEEQRKAGRWRQPY